MNIKSLFSKWFNLAIWQQVIVGLLLGMVCGIYYGPATQVLKPLGDAFIHALHMVIVPVILSAVVCAVTNITDLSQIKRITFKAFFIYASFLIIATVLAIFIGGLVSPGLGLNPSALSEIIHNHGQAINGVHELTRLPGVLDIFVEMVPKNPVAAFVNENILQIVVFGILLGIAINLSGEQGKPVVSLFRSMAAVSKNLTNIVMSFAPYGVFALIAHTFGIFGWKAIIPLFKFIFTLSLSCLSLILLVYGTLIIFYLKKSPLGFYKKIFPAIIYAISTSSSGATLPVSMRIAEEELNVPHNISKFLLPLGCNFNLSGLAIYLTVAVVFTANMYGIALSLTQYIFLVSTVILTTMGTGAIPGSGIVVMSAVLSTMGLPLGALPIIAGIDRISDMIQTATNVISDIFAAYLVSESENKTSEEIIVSPCKQEVAVELNNN